MKYLFGLFLMVHGLIHAAYLAQVPDQNYPFTLKSSPWTGVPTGALETIGTVLVVFSIIGFLLAGLSYMGWLVPVAWFKLLVLFSSLASGVLIGIFWHNTFVVGLLIDFVLFVWVFLKK